MVIEPVIVDTVYIDEIRIGTRLDHRVIRAAAPSTIEKPRVDEQSTTDDASDLPWIVLVWNDPVNLMSYVTFVFQKLFGYSRDKATKLMLDVHEKGKAVVSSGTRERAEMDVYRLHEHGLWATMHKDGSGGEAS